MQVTYRKDSNITGCTVVSIEGKDVGSIHKLGKGEFVVLDARTQRRIPGFKKIGDAKKYFEKQPANLRRP